MTDEACEDSDLAHRYLKQKHFLQSAAWGDFQKALGNEVIKKQGTAADGSPWEYLAIVERGNFSSRLYCPYGPVVSSRAGLEAALASLTLEAKSYLVEFVRVEPRITFLSPDELKALGLKSAARNVQPPDTIIYPVQASEVTEDAILKRAKSSRRQSYKYSLRDGVEFTASNDPADIRYFLDMIHVVAERTGMQPHEDSYFTTLAEVLFPQKTAGMLISKLDNEPLASLIYYSDGITFGYAHAGSFDVQRKLAPPASLFMYAQLFAREQGHTFVDGYGVAPEGAGKDHPWSGFTFFKESFGGTRIHYPGTWELPVSKLRYALYNVAGKILEK